MLLLTRHVDPCVCATSLTDLGTYAARLGDLGRVAKPRVVALFLLTAWTSLVLASGRLWPDSTPAVLVGLGLAVGGAGALNQYLERDSDGLMARTRDRALPQGRLPAWSVLGAGSVACVTGVVLLWVAVSPLCAALAAAGAAYYLLVYTILLKPRSPWSAVAGGPAGLFPVLVGWAAADGSFTVVTLYLCALVFLWSPAHFWALAVARGDEYASAGFPTPVSARGAGHAGLLVVLYVVSIAAVSLLPAVRGDFGGLYLEVAAVGGVALGVAAVRMCRVPAAARALFLHKASGVYLAAVFVAMVVDRVIGRSV